MAPSGAAGGAPPGLVTAPAGGTRLGTDRYPWYPQTKVFSPAQTGDWGPVMAEISEDLAALVASY